MPAFPLLTASMLSGDEERAKVIGGVVHHLVTGTVVFGLICAALFTVFGSAAWWVGVLIGLVHGVVVGIMVTATSPRWPATRRRVC